MATPTVHPVGADSVNGGGDFALMRTAWSGMVHQYLQGQTPFLGTLTRKQAKPGSNGLDFQFWGAAKVHNWDKGKSLVRDVSAADSSQFISEIARTEKTIYLDRPVVSSERIDGWESFMSDPDEQRHVAQALVEAIVQERHFREMSTLFAASVLTTNPMGVGVTTPSASHTMGTTPTAAAVKAAISANVVELRARGFTNGKYTCVLRDDWYQAWLLDEPNAISKDFSSGNGGLDSGLIREYLGVRIMSTNAFTRAAASAAHDTSSVINNPWGGATGYNGFTAASYNGIMYHEGAAGVIERGGITSTVLDRREEYGMIAPAVQFTAGYNTLRTDAAIALHVAAV